MSDREGRGLGIDAVELVGQVQSGERSAVAIVQHYLERVNRINPALNAFVEVWPDSALQQAERIDQRRARGEALGPLAGLPIGLKDNLCLSGQVCSCGSRMLSGFKPTYSATVCERLLAGDAILLGRTNMDEFAMGSGTEYSVYGPTRNPWTRRSDSLPPDSKWSQAESMDRSGYSPGGSSGGSASAVSADLVPLSLGSDTGGSVRQPAAFCGIYGLKPTYGRVSRYGLIAYASSLDQVGPLARSPRDLALLFSVIQGTDPKDATSLPEALVDSRRGPSLASAVSGLRVGLIRSQLEQDLSPGVRAGLDWTVERLKAGGASIEQVDLPFAEETLSAYYLIASCEASSNLARYDGMHFGHRAVLQGNADLEATMAASREEGFGAEVKRRVLLGTYALSHGYADRFYQQASRLRTALRQAYQAAFANCDVLLGPTTPAEAFPVGCHRQDPVAMYLTDQFTVGANLTGLPALSLPVPVNSRPDLRDWAIDQDWPVPVTALPVSVQLQGPACSDERMIEIAQWLHGTASEERRL